MESEDSGDRRRECGEWAPVVGVQDYPVLDVGDNNLLDNGADLVDRRVEGLVFCQSSSVSRSTVSCRE